MWETVHNLPLWFMVIARFFLSLFSWLWNHVQRQQQKNRVRLGDSLWDGLTSGSVGASRFESFLGIVRWFLSVEDDFGWFQVVCCFSSYTNFPAYGRVNSLAYFTSHMIDWGHLIFLLKVKQQKKDYSCFVA